MKKNKIKAIIAIALLLIIFIGATYAYFSSQIGGAGTANVTLTTKTTDSLTFQTGSDITLGPVTTSNFTNGGSNVSGSTTASATLRANNNTNQASETYNVYLRINENTFHKTSANAELLLTITDPSNNAVTSLTGLTYTTVNGVSGFDVTESTGLIQIANNRAISVTGAVNNPKVETWNITLTFVNLGSDQTDNAGASFSAEAIIQKDELWTDKYWNDDFEYNDEYYHPNTPVTTYKSRELLESNYANFASRPYYIKTTSSEHQVCLYYNNHEFCFGANFWDTDSSTTLTKLQIAMQTALGTSASSSYSNGSGAGLVFGSFDCYAHSDYVGCEGYNTSCDVVSDGYARCGSSSW